MINKYDLICGRLLNYVLNRLLSVFCIFINLLHLSCFPLICLHFLPCLWVDRLTLSTCVYENVLCSFWRSSFLKHAVMSRIILWFFFFWFKKIALRFLTSNNVKLSRTPTQKMKKCVFYSETCIYILLTWNVCCLASFERPVCLFFFFQVTC